MSSMRVSEHRGEQAGVSRVRAGVVVRSVIVCALLIMSTACATRMAPAPALPAVLKHPDFMFPVVPQALQRAPGVDRIDPGWRYLQNDDVRNASREFTAALKVNPRLYPAQTGEAYVELARRDHDRAIAAFDAVLAAAPNYV